MFNDSHSSASENTMAHASRATPFARAANRKSTKPFWTTSLVLHIAHVKQCHENIQPNQVLEQSPKTLPQTRTSRFGSGKPSMEDSGAAAPLSHVKLKATIESMKMQ
ncbi:hypothetical protein J3459_015780 [Metarhizium acridum]|nr:hypothetical protein J3459_015780 [Metarhizium acridum]